MLSQRLLLMCETYIQSDAENVQYSIGSIDKFVKAKNCFHYRTTSVSGEEYNCQNIVISFKIEGL